MPALRDIINHYITESVVTFEMVEMSLENRKTWFTQFTEDGRYQLMVAERGMKCWVCRKSALPPAPRLCAFRNDQHLPSPRSSRKGIGEKVYSALLQELKKVDDVHRAYGLVVLPIQAPKNCTKN